MSGWIVFVGFLLFCAAACRRARKPLVARPHQPRAATWPELAYLSGMENKKPRGGEARLADSWWAILHHRGYLVAQDPFKEVRLAPHADLSSVPEEVDQAAKLLRSKSVWKPSEILATWRPLTLATEKEVMAAGWMYAPTDWACQRFWHGVPVLAVIPAAMLGILMLDLPVWAFLPMLFAALLAAYLAPQNDILTPGGVVRLSQARTSHAARLRAPRDPQDLYLVVALAGPAALMGTPLADHAGPSLSRSGGDGGSGCGSDVGATGWSDGGSSDGDGGGCGGCGGD